MIDQAKGIILSAKVLVRTSMSTLSIFDAE